MRAGFFPPCINENQKRKLKMEDEIMIREIKNSVYYVICRDEDDYVDYMGFIEADNLEIIMKWIVENFSSSYSFSVDDLQYHDCIYEGLISKLKIKIEGGK